MNNESIILFISSFLLFFCGWVSQSVFEAWWNVQHICVSGFRERTYVRGCVCVWVRVCVLACVCVCVFEKWVPFKSSSNQSGIIAKINVQKKSQVIESLCVNFYLKAIKSDTWVCLHADLWCYLLSMEFMSWCIWTPSILKQAILVVNFFFFLFFLFLDYVSVSFNSVVFQPFVTAASSLWLHEHAFEELILDTTSAGFELRSLITVRMWRHSLSKPVASFLDHAPPWLVLLIWAPTCLYSA